VRRLAREVGKEDVTGAAAAKAVADGLDACDGRRTAAPAPAPTAAASVTPLRAALARDALDEDSRGLRDCARRGVRRRFEADRGGELLRGREVVREVALDVARRDGDDRRERRAVVLEDLPDRERGVRGRIEAPVPLGGGGEEARRRARAAGRRRRRRRRRRADERGAVRLTAHLAARDCFRVHLAHGCILVLRAASGGEVRGDARGEGGYRSELQRESEPKRRGPSF
jgi:hypothetical protein